MSKIPILSLLELNYADGVLEISCNCLRGEKVIRDCLNTYFLKLYAGTKSEVTEFIRCSLLHHAARSHLMA